MKVEIVKRDLVCRLPEMGELWKHVNEDTVFMRVKDVAVEKNMVEHSFTSVVLKSGSIVRTLRKDSGTCVILEAGSLEVKEVLA